jgi:Fe-S-cluster containining protein
MDLKDADLTWIRSIELQHDGTFLKVELAVPMGANAGAAKYEEFIPLGASTPKYLDKAAHAFAEAVVKAIRERVVTKVPEVKCVTCTAACCARVYNEVAVTGEDARVMGAELVAKGVELYPNGERSNGYVGLLKRIPWKGKGTATIPIDSEPMACIFLDPKSSVCTVYERRPNVCRTFHPHECDVHEPAPEPLVQLRRARFAAGAVQKG